eukprot:1235098-Rhodomonas_salina.1
MAQRRDEGREGWSTGYARGRTRGVSALERERLSEARREREGAEGERGREREGREGAGLTEGSVLGGRWRRSRARPSASPAVLSTVRPLPPLAAFPPFLPLAA